MVQLRNILEYNPSSFPFLPPSELPAYRPAVRDRNRSTGLPPLSPMVPDTGKSASLSSSARKDAKWPLPPDILHKVCEDLRERNQLGSLASLMRTNNDMYAIAGPILYRELNLRNQVTYLYPGQRHPRIEWPHNPHSNFRAILLWHNNSEPNRKLALLNHTHQINIRGHIAFIAHEILREMHNGTLPSLRCIKKTLQSDSERELLFYPSRVFGEPARVIGCFMYKETDGGIQCITHTTMADPFFYL